MLPTRGIVENLQAEVDALLTKLDRGDPRLAEIERVLNNARHEAQKIRPDDADFASSSAYGAVLNYARFSEFHRLLEEEDVKNGLIIPKTEIRLPGGVIPYWGAIREAGESVVLPKQAVILYSGIIMPAHPIYKT